MPDPVDTDHQGKPARPARRHPGGRVLQNDRTVGLGLQPPRRLEKDIGRRLALQTDAVADHPVDPGLEQIAQAGRLQNLDAVAARRDDRQLQPGRPPGLDPVDRVVEDLGAILFQELEEHAVLVVAEATHRFVTRSVRLLSFGQGDAARRQETAHSVVARLAVDVGAIVALDIERHELRAVALGPRLQKPVEHPLPGPRVHHGGPGDDAIEIQQHGIESPLRISQYPLRRSLNGTNINSFQT